MTTRYLYFAILLSFTVQAQIYSGTTALGLSLTLNVTMNTNSDSLEMEFSGPSYGYYCLGIGSAGLNGTHIVLVNSNGTIAERELSHYNGGSVLASSITYRGVPNWP